jgi:sulfate adenylyltransferase subunit 1 (EFTu-like GTPase family)
VFESIREDFTRLVPAEATHAIPLAAPGDASSGERARLVRGQALLPYLETVEVERERAAGAFRMPVQLVSRPDPRSGAVRDRSCQAASRSATR